MEIRELSDLLQRAGVVDAGSAGLPAHAMLEACAGTVLLNCADREPLLKTAEVLTQLYPEEVAEGLRIVLEAVGAVSGLVRIRNGTQAEAAERMISVYPHLTFVEPLSDCPAGDDEIIAGEASAPEAVILEAETAYRIARAVKYDEPVTEKFVTVSGEIAHSGVYRVPTGTTLRDLVEWANRTLPLNEVRVWLGGPMTGRPGTWDEPVTKTTNGIIVLPRDHSLFRNAGIPASVQLRRAASACDGCGRCTDLCPRSGMGYPIRPHLFMRAAAQRDFSDPSVFLNSTYCSGCGICELYACPQSLSPRSLITEYRERLREKGIKVPAKEEMPANDSAFAEHQSVRGDQIVSAHGLKKYDGKVPAELMSVEMQR